MIAGPTSRNQRAVLIVDDDDGFRNIIGEAISKEGDYQVHSADSGEAALEALQSYRFDAILLDFRMSGISGLDVLRWMKEKKISTPVVMLTAMGTESVAVEAMKLGAYDYIQKERLDVDHVRILIDGVIERYLFRKEKDRREAMEREREKSLVAISTFNDTLSTIAKTVNNSLSTVSLNIRQYEVNLKPFVGDEGQRRLSRAFGELREEYTVITSAVESMLDMTKVLKGNFPEADSPTRLSGRMNGNLKNAQKQDAAGSLVKNPYGS